MEVRRLVVAVKHPNDDSEKATHLGHGLTSSSRISTPDMGQDLHRVVEPATLMNLDIRPSLVPLPIALELRQGSGSQLVFPAVHIACGSG
jgi:hypothetical protein